MIARLVGLLISRDMERAVIDVRDVGYAVRAAKKDLDAWAQAEGKVEIHISTDVREDAITLYGFSADLDRVAFERLRQVSGVGPKVALATLDTLDLAGLVGAVEAGNLTALTKIPGVGKKLAQRMALELKGKLPAGFTAPQTGAAAAAPEPDAGPDPLVFALERFGYSRSEINRAKSSLEREGLGPSAPVAKRIQRALRLLSPSAKEVS